MNLVVFLWVFSSKFLSNRVLNKFRPSFECITDSNLTFGQSKSLKTNQIELENSKFLPFFLRKNIQILKSNFPNKNKRKCSNWIVWWIFHQFLTPLPRTFARSDFSIYECLIFMDFSSSQLAFGVFLSLFIKVANLTTKEFSHSTTFTQTFESRSQFSHP